MADITMCEEEHCKQKADCYRYTAPVSLYQAYFLDSPLEEDGMCYEYWDNEGRMNNA